MQSSNQTRQRFLITGGAGFIGSAVIRYLIKATNHEVINVDKLTYAGNLESLAEVASSKHYHFEQVDICDHEGITQLFKHYQPSIVMHLAAESHVDRSINGPAAFIQTNINGTYVMLEAARQHWLSLNGCEKEQFRFHHISTDEVYGSLGESDLFTEESSYDPSSPYSASKASSDHLVRAWHRTYGLPIIITNCSNNYGPYQFPEKLIPLIILNALIGKSLPIYGKGNQVRDWIYVEDHAKALYKVVMEGIPGETYNIGSSNEKTNIDLVTTLCGILEELAPNNAHSSKNGSPEGFKSLITYVDDRPGHDQRYAIDASKIIDDLKWEPEETFETSIRKTVIWYLENKEWIKHVASGEFCKWIEVNYATRGAA